jgi:hypothetical protein
MFRFVHLVEPAAVAPVPLRVGGGVSKTLIVLEAVWDHGVTVAADCRKTAGGTRTVTTNVFDRLT